MRLTQVRPCDGQCCRESPRFPDGHGDCIYHMEQGCAVMFGEATLPDEPSVIFPEKSAAHVFEETCMNWPHNTPLGPGYTGTGGCCWQWIVDGN